MGRVCLSATLVLLTCGACGDSTPEYARVASSGRERDAGASDEADAAQYAGNAPSASSKPPPLHGAAGSGGASDAGAAASDAGAAAPTPGLRLPEVEPARYVSDARHDHDCAAVPGVTSFYAPPSLHVIGDTIYVFSVDSSEAVPEVLLHVSSVDDFSFGEPTTLIYGARPVDLIAQGDELRALAGRQFYTVELASTDGTTFEESQPVGPHEPTYNCDGYPPPRYFRGREPAELAVVGSDYNTGLFGCYERVFVAHREADGWAEPVEVGRGDAVFAYQGETRALIVTNLGVLQSDDGAETFTALANFDAAGGVATASRVLLARATPDGILTLESRDGAETWERQTRVLTDTSYGGVFIAGDGDAVALAVLSSTAIVISASFDGAGSWTEPQSFDGSGALRLLGLAQHGATTYWLTANADDSLVLCRLR